MRPEMQRKFREGSTYHMKIVIRGDRETGKTALLRRLEGKRFRREHVPTPQIQVAHIDWNYKTRADVVQVEVWDVVDEAQAAGAETKRLRSLAADQDLPQDAVPAAAAADASTVDVYKKCQAVLIMIDPTRPWTFEYAQAEVRRVPEGVQTLLMANFRDLESRRRVSEVDIENFLRKCGDNVNYIECCMLNGYGLKQLYNWINIPFLKLKRASLERELRLAAAELATAQREAELVQEQDYETYLNVMASKMRVAASGSDGVDAMVRKQGPIPSMGRSERRTGARRMSAPAASRLNSSRPTKHPQPIAEGPAEAADKKKRDSAKTRASTRNPRSRRAATAVEAGSASTAASSYSTRNGDTSRTAREAEARSRSLAAVAAAAAAIPKQFGQDDDDDDDDLDDFVPGGKLSSNFFGDDDDDDDDSVKDGAGSQNAAAAAASRVGGSSGGTGGGDPRRVGSSGAGGRGSGGGNDKQDDDDTSNAEGSGGDRAGGYGLDDTYDNVVSDDSDGVLEGQEAVAVNAYHVAPKHKQKDDKKDAEKDAEESSADEDDTKTSAGDESGRRTERLGSERKRATVEAVTRTAESSSSDEDIARVQTAPATAVTEAKRAVHERGSGGGGGNGPALDSDDDDGGAAPLVVQNLKGFYSDESDKDASDELEDAPDPATPSAPPRPSPSPRPARRLTPRDSGIGSAEKAPAVDAKEASAQGVGTPSPSKSSKKKKKKKKDKSRGSDDDGASSKKKKKKKKKKKRSKE